jgi:hypothetical protein
VTQKPDESRWKSALQRQAQRRDEVMQKKGNGVEWGAVRKRLEAKLAAKDQKAI